MSNTTFAPAPVQRLVVGKIYTPSAAHGRRMNSLGRSAMGDISEGVDDFLSGALAGDLYELNRRIDESFDDGDELTARLDHFWNYDEFGFDERGYNRLGFDHWGFDIAGYDVEGFNFNGLDRQGYDRNGRDIWGDLRPGAPDYSYDDLYLDYYEEYHYDDDFYCCEDCEYYSVGDREEDPLLENETEEEELSYSERFEINMWSVLSESAATKPRRKRKFVERSGRLVQMRNSQGNHKADWAEWVHGIETKRGSAMRQIAAAHDVDMVGYGYFDYQEVLDELAIAQDGFGKRRNSQTVQEPRKCFTSESMNWGVPRVLTRKEHDNSVVTRTVSRRQERRVSAVVARRPLRSSDEGSRAYGFGARTS